jgi:triacylglycerol esterase/lipase EstA (alpha/beta hydrolase family)
MTHRLTYLCTVITLFSVLASFAVAVDRAQAQSLGIPHVPMPSNATAAETTNDRTNYGLTTPDPEARGDRSPLILIHGVGRSRNDWWWFINQNEAHLRLWYKIYTFQYNGNDAIYDSAEFLRNAIQRHSSQGGELGTEALYFVGHSMGGLVARSYIEEQGGDKRLGKLITLGTPHHGSPLAHKKWIHPLVESIPYFDQMMQLVMGLDTGSPGAASLRWDNEDQVPAADGFDGIGGSYAAVLNSRIRSHPGRDSLLSNYVCYAGYETSYNLRFPRPLSDSGWRKAAASTLAYLTTSQDRYLANDSLVPLQSALFLDLRGGYQHVAHSDPGLLDLSDYVVHDSEAVSNLQQVGEHRVFPGVLHGGPSGLYRSSAVLDSLAEDLRSSRRRVFPVIDWGPVDPYAPRTVRLSGSRSFSPFGPIAAYRWNFGDGSPSAEGLEVTHQFPSTVNYFVTLQVVDVLGRSNTVSTLVNAWDVPQPTTGPTEVRGPLTGNCLWRRTAGPYIIRSDVFLAADSTLTIEPGTVVKLATRGSLTIRGTLSSNGTPRERIVFTSLADDTAGGDTNSDGAASQPKPGDWLYLAVEGSGASATFDCCDFRYGGRFGGQGAPMVSVADAVAVAVTNSRLVAADFDRFSTGMMCIRTPVAVSGCTFRRCARALWVTHCPSASITGCIFENNAPNTGYSDFVSNLATAVTAYEIGALAVTGNLFRENGAAVRLSGVLRTPTIRDNIAVGAGLKAVFCDGLNLVGDATLERNEALPYVPALLNSTSPSLRVLGGARLTFEAGVVVKVNRHMRIEGVLDALGTSDAPIIFTSFKDDSIDGDTNGDGVATSPGTGDWENIFINGAGANARFEHCQIRFGSRDGSSGASMVAAYNASGLLLQNCRVSDASFNYISAGVQAWGTPTIVENCTLVGNYTGLSLYDAPSADVTGCTFTGNTQALRVKSVPSLTLEGNVFRDNQSAVELTGTLSQPIIRGNSGQGSGFNGLYCTDLTLQGGTTLHENPNLAYVFRRDEVKVPAGSSLTLDRGTVAKFYPSPLTAGQLECRGTLTLQGAPGKPVVITSIHDDSAGGDTNGDGGATQPQPGEGGAIVIEGGQARARVEHAEFRFSAIRANSATDLAVLSSAFVRAPLAAVYTDTTPASFSDCVFDGNGQGVFASGLLLSVSRSRFVANDVGIDCRALITGSQVRASRFEGNRRALVNNSGAVIDARFNWWEHASGPLDRSDDRQSGGWYNPAGQGDEVSNLVRYEPWFGTLIPPGTAPQLQATGSGPGRIQLTWTGSYPPGTLIEIDRKLGSSPYAAMPAVDVVAGSFLDAGLQDGATYTYRARAITAGGESGYSNETTATATAPKAYAISGTIRAGDRGVAGVSISAANKSTLTDTDGRYQIPDLPAGTYTVTPTKAGFTFRPVSATLTLGPGDALADFSAVPEVPAAPTNLAASSVSAVAVTLSWKDNSTSERGFRIEQRIGTGPFAPLQTVGANATSTLTRLISQLQPSTAYTLRVVAFNDGGDSAWSNEVKVTTLVGVRTLGVSPTTTAGGRSVKGTVSLTSAAPTTGLTVTLASSNSAATPPRSVRIAARKTSATFTISTKRVTTATTLTITGALNGSSKPATLNVTR